MVIPAKYILTPKISQLLASIESSKAIIDSIPIPPEIEMNIRRRSSLKSSLFSARIEGNSLTLDELKTGSKEQKQVEVFNILKALNMIHQRPLRNLTSKDILNLHQTVLSGLIEKSDLGRFRSEQSAIFNSAGIAIYMPPPPRQINTYINKLLSYINSNKQLFVPIRACLAHYSFEKIHPFLDGNGRVGRLLIQIILAKGGYDMKGLLALEEYLDKNRTSYYRYLDDPERDVTDYLEFMLEAIAESANEAKLQVLEKKDAETEDYLLPRRAEIFNIIKDHKIVNFETIRRRFISINERTLRYDLKKLQDAGLIRKRGTTKGVYYECNKG
jgi:Fic family protein